ncbi:STAS domain-containing protein [Streptomyces sp. ICBB 8177]|uniref:STAS domain-containing protein n=1 Tax=Streptomyces sp. ICBB 8177 TaxID=563922 RepID=UPI000D67AAB6|nr:STAS domain-containing protein [Streptomyces sp. ICBB 8177]PWI45065.1 anti-anti-sigma factor [Streptomyces sp. ICBB 8177]
MSPLKITTDHTETGPVLHLAGELDYDHATALRDQTANLSLAPGQSLILDLSGVEFCDSSGIAALLGARQLAQSLGADIVLASVPPNTLRLLTLVGLDRVFTIRPQQAPPA